MRKHVFLRIIKDLPNHGNYFNQRFDVAGKEDISPLAKCTIAMRMLAYSTSADSMDEYIKIGETTAFESLLRFCKGIIQLYEEEYLRAPTDDDLEKILKDSEKRGFPGMIGSVDYMHWEWKNCPTIWYFFFECSGTLNNINILDQSPLFDDVEQGRDPRINFEVNQHQYKMAYYLADGIYHSYPTFVKSIRLSQSDGDKLFAKYQESFRKDIKRALECSILDLKSFKNQLECGR